MRQVSGGIITTVTGPFDPINSLAVDSNGSLYIASAYQNWIGRVSGGVFTIIVGNAPPGFSGDGGPATSAGILGPTSVVVDATGNVYFVDSGNQRVRVLVPSGPTCAYSLDSQNLTMPASGGTAKSVIQTASSCSWNVSRLPTWITGPGAGTGTGSASVSLTAASNPGPPRTVFILIAGLRVAITQEGAVPAGPALLAVENAGSNLTGPIAPGEIVALYGSGLGPAQLAEAQVDGGGLFPQQLAGTSVSFNGLPAPLIYTSAAQVAAVVPYGIGGTTAQVIVTYQGQASAALSLGVTNSSPGLFSLDSTGRGQAAAVNQDGSINGPTTPAKMGDIISIYATGEGQTTPSGVDGKPAGSPLPKPILPLSVTIGGQPAEVQYAGGAPDEIAGLMQLNVRIPNGILSGESVPVILHLGSGAGFFSQGGVTITVSGNKQ